MTRSQWRIAAPVVALAALAIVFSPASVPAAEPWTKLTTRAWLDQMSERYAPLEDFPPQATRGTGFKPFHRYKWLVEPRLNPETGDMDPGARWKAYEELRRMEAAYGTRSETWFNVGPVNVAGRCLAIEIHPTNPNIVYAGFASSSIWKTTDGAATWTPLDDYLPTLAISAIEIDTSDPDRIWIGTGEGWGNVDAVHGVGVLVSTDAGATWGTTGLDWALSQGRDVFELEYNPATGTLMAATGSGLWRSTDQGATFTQIDAQGDWKDIELKRGSSSVMFASVNSHPAPGFYISTDDGATWTRTTTGAPTTLGNHRFALTDADPNLILWAIATSNGTQQGIWKSTDGGASFAQVFGNGNHYSNQGWYDLTIEIHPTNPNNCWSGGVNFYRSTNGGTGWTQFAPSIHVDHHATAFAPSNPNIFYVGSDGGVWRSTNGGSSFVDVNAGLVTMQFYAINHAETNPALALGGTQDNGTWRYNNSGSWAYVLGGDGFQCEIDRVNPSYMYAELYYGEHYASTNGGSNFVPRNSGITEDGLWETPTHMDFSNPSIIWTAHNTKIFRTTNRMGSWTWMNNPAGLGGGRNIHQCRNHPEVLVVVGGSRVWVTTDTGATWTNKTGSLVTLNAISDVHCHPDDPNTWVITVASYSTQTHQVFKTTDAGTTWVAIDDGLPEEPANTIEIDPLNPDWYFIGTDLGVYWSPNAGASWVPFNTGLPHVVVDDLRIHSPARLLHAGTHGRGMWEVDISGLGVESAEDPRPAVEPVTLRIFGNPATDRVTLRYGTRRPGQVRLALYDVQGRLVKPLLDEQTYGYLGALDVDVTDLPAGVYFARLSAQGSEVSQKLVIER